MRRTTAPLPGRPVRGSTTGRPLMAALDLLGRRFALRVVWELRDGPLTFRELAHWCGGVSPSSLNTRIHELREAGVVEDSPYALTRQGRNLLEAIAPLAKWAQRWESELTRKTAADEHKGRR